MCISAGYVIQLPKDVCNPHQCTGWGSGHIAFSVVASQPPLQRVKQTYFVKVSKMKPLKNALLPRLRGGTYEVFVKNLRLEYTLAN